MFSFARCHNNVPKPGWVKTIETYCVIVLEAGSPTSRCRQGHAPSDGSRGGSFLATSQFLVFTSNSWCSWLGDASLQSHGHLFLCVFTTSTFCTCLSLNLCPNFCLFLFLLFFVCLFVLAVPYSMRDLSFPLPGIEPLSPAENSEF